jgi:hypothetical protein
MRKILTIAATAAFAATTAHADINIGSFTGDFKAFAEDMSSAFSYKPNIPTEPLAGLIPIGFDVGVSLSSTKLASADKYGAGVLDGDTTVVLPTLRAHVGIPFGIDVGAAYASYGNVKYTGGEIRYAIMKGGVALPAVGIRGSMSKISGVDNFDFSSKGVDLSISKGILMLTPYAGVGRVWSDVKATVGASNFSEDVSQTKVFAGVGFKVLLLNLNIEADKTGDATTYAAKVGLRF